MQENEIMVPKRCQLKPSILSPGRGLCLLLYKLLTLFRGLHEALPLLLRLERGHLAPDVGAHGRRRRRGDRVGVEAVAHAVGGRHGLLVADCGGWYSSEEGKLASAGLAGPDPVLFPFFIARMNSHLRPRDSPRCTPRTCQTCARRQSRPLE